VRVTADYGRIREENVARYGWDTAVLDLLGQLYSERTHFIFELMQNAEDAGASWLAFELFGDRLEVRHDGRAFTEADVRGVCGVGLSGKGADLTAIGKFGIGFKSVYAYTRTPRIYSAGERFRIETYVRPYPEEPAGVPDGQTLFVFPFDHDGVPAAVAVAEISAALNRLQPRILLFLTGIGRLRAGGAGVTGSVIERRAQPRGGASRGGETRGGASRGGASRDGASRDGASRDGETRGGASRRVRLRSGRGRAEEWLIWQRQVEGLGAAGPRIEIAFRADGGRITGCGSSPLTVYFPTEKETFLGFLVQGPYRTTPARDNVPEQDPSNQALVRQTAALLADVLRELRDEDLLTVDVLTALPLDAARFGPGSMFRPLFESVRDALSREELIPAAGGGCRAAGQLRLAQGAALRELLGPEQLSSFLQKNKPVRLAHESITERGTPVLWRYLREEIGVGEITAEGFAAGLTGDFLREQPDEWVARLYAFLLAEPSLWRDGEAGPARARPIIRLEDGSHVAPFDAGGRPAAYLPGPAASGLPTVRRPVAGSPAARRFLEALGLREPDVVAEALEIILPRYDRLDAGGLDQAQHDADLDCVMRALDEAPAGRRAELLERLQRTAFLVGENAATGEQRLMPPPELYQRTPDLEVYFGGNPGAWFAGDRYGPWLSQLRAMGVRQGVQVRARAANQLGHVVITAEFGRNERGVDGFDPEAEIDGLEFALGHPSHGRSEYVWNVLLAPNRRLVAGVIERSVLASFGDSTAEEARSAIAAAAEREAWLPGRDGVFRRPAEVSLDDLPPTFTRDEGLARALHMLQPVVAEAARRLGVPAGVLWGLGAHPDLVAMVQRELAAREVTAPGPPGSAGG
jgi:hypothetical protein